MPNTAEVAWAVGAEQIGVPNTKSSKTSKSKNPVSPAVMVTLSTLSKVELGVTVCIFPLELSPVTEIT